MKEYQLGEFEELVILTVGILDNAAYSVAIRDEIESRLFFLLTRLVIEPSDAPYLPCG